MIEVGLGIFCFTEHRLIETSQPAMKIAIPIGFLGVKGAEIPTNCDHLLVYGLSDDIWNRCLCNHHPELEQVIDSVHCLRGICVLARPFRGCPLGVWRGNGERSADCFKQMRPL